MSSRASKSKQTLKSKVSPGNETLATPVLLRGSNLSKFASTENLGLVESGTAFGMNTSAMYGIINKDLPLKTPLAILLRLYSAFPEKLPRMTTPSFGDFVDLIRKVEPEFKDYSVGPLLGIDKNSIYRIREVGFEECKDATKILINVIYDLLKESQANWSVVKEIVEIEAESRELDPETIWKKGKWKKSTAKQATEIPVPAAKKPKESITKSITWG